MKLEGNALLGETCVSMLRSLGWPARRVSVCLCVRIHTCMCIRQPDVNQLCFVTYIHVNCGSLGSWLHVLLCGAPLCFYIYIHIHTYTYINRYSVTMNYALLHSEHQCIDNMIEIEYIHTYIHTYIDKCIPALEDLDGGVVRTDSMSESSLEGAATRTAHSVKQQ